MNITSLVVSAGLMSIMVPGVAQISVQPMFAQKRASNFGIAEAKAVSYAAKNEGGLALTPVPDGCNTIELPNDAYSITCVEGENSFKQSATRSFRLAVLCDDNDHNNGHGNSGGNDCSNPSGYNTPISYTPGVFCPLWDPWGVINYNDSHNVQCIPVPYGPWAHTYDGPILW